MCFLLFCLADWRTKSSVSHLKTMLSQKSLSTCAKLDESDTVQVSRIRYFSRKMSNFWLSTLSEILHNTHQMHRGCLPIIYLSTAFH